MMMISCFINGSFEVNETVLQVYFSVKFANYYDFTEILSSHLIERWQ